jgi:hypothetical protein
MTETTTERPEEKAAENHWRLEAQTVTYAPRPTTGRIEATLQLANYEAGFAWAFKEEKGQHVQERDARLERVRSDFKASNPACAEMTKVQTTIDSAKARAQAHRGEVVRLTDELNKAILAGEEPFQLRSELEDNKDDVVKLEAWISEDLRSNLARITAAAEAELANSLRDETERIAKEAAQRKAEIYQLLTVAAVPLVLELERVDSILAGLTVQKAIAKFGSLQR